MSLTSAHIAMLGNGSLTATPSTLLVDGHVFDIGKSDERTMLYAAPGSRAMTAIRRPQITDGIIRASKLGSKIAIGYMQLASLYFEIAYESRVPVLTVRDLATAIKADKGYEIPDIIAGDAIVTIIVVEEFDHFQALDANGEPVTESFTD